MLKKCLFNSVVEYLHGKQKVAGSIPVEGFLALVAKLVNAVARGAIVNDLWVQVPSRALTIII